VLFQMKNIQSWPFDCISKISGALLNNISTLDTWNFVWAHTRSRLSGPPSPNWVITHALIIKPTQGNSVPGIKNTCLKGQTETSQKKPWHGGRSLRMCQSKLSCCQPERKRERKKKTKKKETQIKSGEGGRDHANHSIIM
jgi:hypothetical protein